MVDQRGIVTGSQKPWFHVITAALCKLGEEQSERIFSFSRPKAGRTSPPLALHGMLQHDGLSAGFVLVRLAGGGLSGGGLSSAGLSAAGLSSAALTSAALFSSALSTAGLSSPGLSSRACRQQACISGLVVSSLDIGGLEDDMAGLSSAGLSSAVLSSERACPRLGIGRLVS